MSRARRSYPIILALAAWLLGALPRPAEAALGTCTVSATAVAFGVYDPIAAAANDSTGTVTVSCSLVSGISLLVAYSIGLSTGVGSYTTRQMSYLTDYMSYNLYTSGARNIVWGDGSGSTQMIYDGYLLGLGGATTNYTVFGHIPARQNVRGGGYQDNIVVTVTY
ncbi:MAG TPA: spore coat U domain-containing protein [Alphaproteobacteria bacterium]|nr:spore coat U domain-containing protein [Alphaproteobacteria bacterium]